MNVLIISGHPRKKSLTHAIADSYTEGATEAGAECRRLDLCDLSFDPNVTHVPAHDQQLEPDITYSQESITWADHVVFIYPTWWGTMPALLKGFIDRVLTSGFAFREIQGGTGYEALIRNKTAQIITTMDTPAFVYRFIYGSPGHKAMRRATLGFCGFTMIRTIRFGPVRESTDVQRKAWIASAKAEGLKLRRGTLSPTKKLTIPVMNWLKAIRLQFYPMSFIAYTVGAYAADAAGYGFDRTIFWLGYAWLFLLEVTTVLSNDYFDFGSDSKNRYFSPFTGGSRVLVDNTLGFREMRTGIIVTLALSFLVMSLLLSIITISIPTMLIVCGTLFVMALGYTVPPIKLSYRGLGELTVGITHSFAVIVCGYIFQGGGVGDHFAWWLGLPLFLSVLPSIILAGVPDRDADQSVSKRTLAVRFGKKGAARIAMFFTIMAAISVGIYQVMGILPEAFNGILFFVLPHALLLCILITQYVKKENPPQRIDGLLVAALSFIFWFGVIPLINLR